MGRMLFTLTTVGALAAVPTAWAQPPSGQAPGVTLAQATTTVPVPPTVPPPAPEAIPEGVVGAEVEPRANGRSVTTRPWSSTSSAPTSAR